MKLSIVIVNFNVRYFLEQCLVSVERAIEGIDADVWVVDNDSSDDSMDMVRSRFPWVKCIDNEKNVGFSTANNQAANQSNSDFILLLNPDTILPEDNLRQTLAYMDAHPKCGALGIKMHDGSGTFLPESKRGMPSPWVAFYKIFGLSSLFPKSKRFARYHLGHLSETENQRVEILAGAYMLMRREAWEAAGGLDETYFMYGEDIDLSYSIEKAGFEVHYYVDSPIIHYKGESTKKGSLNYVFMFYNAMLIFARKHLSKSYAQVFSYLIRVAIYLRAGVSVAKRVLNKISLPLGDLLLYTGGMQLIIQYWESNHRFIEGGAYPEFYKWGITPAYGALWIVGILLLGGYRKPIQLNRVLLGLGLGTAFIFGLYALSDEAVRFSRALIVLGAGWMTFTVMLLRFSLSLFPSAGMGFWNSGQRKVGFIGNKENISSVQTMLGSQEKAELFMHLNMKDLGAQIYANDINEIIFDGEQLSYKEIIQWIVTWGGSMNLKFQIAYPSRQWMIGSESIHTQGAATNSAKLRLSEPETLRAKRSFDLAVVLFLWLLSPIAIWAPRIRNLWWNSFAVLFGSKTWVGYSGSANLLPKIRSGIIPVKFLTNKYLQDEADRAYAKTADVNLDARILIRYIRMGKQTKN